MSLSVESLAELQLAYADLPVSDIYNTLFTPTGLLMTLSLNDIESIGMAWQTPKASALVEYCTSFMFAHTINIFWCGQQGRTRANEESERLNAKMDSGYPFISLLFKICYLGRDQYSRHTTQMTDVSFAISKIFASRSTHTAYIFIASDKPTEYPGYTVGTNLWNAELPVLRSRVASGDLDAIIVSYCVDGIWSEGVDVDNVDLPIYRRHHHLMDCPTTELSFVKPTYTLPDYIKWLDYPPRKSIKTTLMKKIIRKLRK